MTEKRYGFQDTSYKAAGYEEGLRALVDRFYIEMDRLPEARGIRAMHKPELKEVKDRLTRFLCGWLGGPKKYQEKYGSISIPMAHSPFPIGIKERDAWMLCMTIAVWAQPYDEDFKRYLVEQFAIPAERVRNRD